MSLDVRAVWDAQCELGEGPAWFPDEQALRFVDIRKGLLHRYRPASHTLETMNLGGAPSFVVPCIDDGLLVGSGSSLHRVGTDALGDAVVAIEMPAHNRTNDASVDDTGRVWFGTMDDNEAQPTGALWCLDRGTLHRLGGEAVVTNGPALTPDGQTLYHVDSGERTIWRMTIGTDDTGCPFITEKTVYLQLTERDGHPDGIVLDAEQCLWVALWDGWGVRRYDQNGRLMLHVDMPCARPTKLAFGGPDLRTAYVTSARTGLDAAALSRQPLAGALFAFDAPVSGVRLPGAILA